MKVKVITICLLLILATSFAYAIDIHVPGDFDKIQDALNAALPGDRVLVAAGTYEENITLKSGVELLGAGADVTTIKASTGKVVTAESIGFRIKIDGFTIDGVDRSGGEDYGIYCNNNSSPSISNVTVTNTGDWGIYCSYSSSPPISNVTVTNIGGYGISCRYNSSPPINNVTITNTGNYGIWCDSASPTISNVEITNTGSCGICCGRASPLISNVEITGVKGDGINCQDFSNPKIRESVIKQNFGNGITIGNGSLPDIGIETDPGMEPDPGLNSIFGNAYFDVLNQTPTEVKAEGNWWGQSPPNPAFFSGLVDYDPWLTNPPFTGSITIISPVDGDEFPVGAVVDVVAEVRDQSGQPLADVEVTFEATVGTVDPTVVVTDENGQAKTHLTVAEGENVVTAIVNPDISDTITVIGVVPVTGSIYGTVTDKITGNPIKFAFVIAINAETKEKYKDFTDKNGDYEIPDLPAGKYLVLCIKKGYKAGIKKVEVPPGEADFELIPKLK